MPSEIDLTIIAAVNNDQVLNSCLLNSPDLKSGVEILLLRGHPSAASAYNAGISKAKGEHLVFVHQDVFLPEGWASQLQGALEQLSVKDPNWGVVGAWGKNASGQGVGFLYCTALGRQLGEAFSGGKEVRSLDEVLLITRKSCGLRFDETLGGFHMYGTDICLEAARRGMRNYAISAFCIHNSNGYGLFPWEFWRCAMQMRAKWRAQLPVITPCTEITNWCLPMIRSNIVQGMNILLGRHKPGRRVLNPNQLYQKLNSGLEMK